MRLDRPQPAEQPLRPGIGFIAAAAPELLGIVNMGIEDAGQGELSAPVDDVIIRLRRKLTALAEGGDAAVLDDECAVANDAPGGIDRDDIIDVADDEARHFRAAPDCHARARPGLTRASIEKFS